MAHKLCVNSFNSACTRVTRYSCERMIITTMKPSGKKTQATRGATGVAPQRQGNSNSQSRKSHKCLAA
jgi:hypothetical protein